MKKSILSIFIVSCFLCSCYTKNQAINKFCKQDSVTFATVIHDTIELPGLQADTIYTRAHCDSTVTDSVTVRNGKVSATYVRKGNKVRLSANLQGDTLLYSKAITITAPCNCPPCPEPAPPTFWEKVKTYCINGFAFIGVIALGFITMRLLRASQ